MPSVLDQNHSNPSWDLVDGVPDKNIRDSEDPDVEILAVSLKRPSFFTDLKISTGD